VKLQIVAVAAQKRALSSRDVQRDGSSIVTMENARHVKRISKFLWKEEFLFFEKMAKGKFFGQNWRGNVIFWKNCLWKVGF
jgi:hypothetical protein